MKNRISSSNSLKKPWRLAVRPRPTGKFVFLSNFMREGFEMHR